MSSSSSETPPCYFISSEMSLKDAFNLLESRDFIEDVVKTKEQANIMMDKLSDCDCCYHHTVHRPCHINDNLWKQHLPIEVKLPNGEIEWQPSYRKCKCFHNDFGIDDDESCECPCRHYCRQIQDIINKN